MSMFVLYHDSNFFERTDYGRASGCGLRECGGRGLGSGNAGARAGLVLGEEAQKEEDCNQREIVRW